MSDITERLVAAANAWAAKGRLLDLAVDRIQLLEHTLRAVVRDHPAGLAAGGAWVKVSAPCGARIEDCKPIERLIPGLRYLHTARGDE